MGTEDQEADTILMSISEVLLSLLYFNKTLTQKNSERLSFITWPGLNSSPLEGQESWRLSQLSNSISPP